MLDLVGASKPARALLAGGTVLAAIGALFGLPGGAGSLALPFGDWTVRFRADPAGLWLLLPSLFPAFFAVVPAGAAKRGQGWASGAAMSLLGALGVLGLQDGASFLIAWEALGLGGAMMLLAEHRTPQAGQDNLFMLALLEAGSVALLFAVLLLGPHLDFASYAARWHALGTVAAFLLACLWLVGFGAKLGLLPFYEWYPGAYGHGSGASGAILSGTVMNAAYFALGRALLQWLGSPPWLAMLGVVVLAAGTLTAILAILYAFQQDDWRRLLAFSSAENAGVAVTALGAALIFRAEGQAALAGLAWTVGMLHLMGHSLAKGTLFLASDAVAELEGGYRVRQAAILRRAPLTLGLGALFGAMSLAALPPTAGFVSEWYVFQSLFHDFVVANNGARIALALAGAGLALTAAISLATMVKLFGVGLLGQYEPHGSRMGHNATALPAMSRAAVLAVGIAVPTFAASMIWWLPRLQAAAWPAPGAPALMVHERLLVPLSPGFAFISPATLIVVMPLLALVPLTIVARSRRRFAVRRAPVWCGGEDYAAHAGATTALAFSNALRVFYSFIYRPTNAVVRQFEGKPYFLKELKFDYSQAPIFGHFLFKPLLQSVEWLTRKLRFLQNGLMNAYLAYIGLLLLLVLATALLWSPIPSHQP
ncbi:MAG: proton-conducting transporter membrane subunit [Betaproteobacteria bacterium]|nr:proton-conducting transporter membrane subunit [Betaproteobacteria bacterium]